MPPSISNPLFFFFFFFFFFYSLPPVSSWGLLLRLFSFSFSASLFLPLFRISLLLDDCASVDGVSRNCGRLDQPSPVTPPVVDWFTDQRISASRPMAPDRKLSFISARFGADGHPQPQRRGTMELASSPKPILRFELAATDAISQCFNPVGHSRFQCFDYEPQFWGWGGVGVGFWGRLFHRFSDFSDFSLCVSFFCLFVGFFCWILF